MSPSVGIWKKPTLHFFPSCKITSCWVLWSCGEFKARELTVAGEGPSASLLELTLRFSETSARRRVGRMWTSTCLSGGLPTGHGVGPPGKPDS